MTSNTDRWYASSRHVYARALLRLSAYARTHADDFSFGPLDLPSLENQGLVITGSDLAGAREVLGKVAGLVQEQPEIQDLPGIRGAGNSGPGWLPSAQ